MIELGMEAFLVLDLTMYKIFIHWHVELLTNMTFITKNANFISIYTILPGVV
jgi:hypothetical protein